MRVLIITTILATAYASVIVPAPVAVDCQQLSDVEAQAADARVRAEDEARSFAENARSLAEQAQFQAEENAQLLIDAQIKEQDARIQAEDQARELAEKAINFAEESKWADEEKREEIQDAQRSNAVAWSGANLAYLAGQPIVKTFAPALINTITPDTSAVAQPAVAVAQPSLAVAQPAFAIAQPALAFAEAGKTVISSQSLTQTHPAPAAVNEAAIIAPAAPATPIVKSAEPIIEIAEAPVAAAAVIPAAATLITPEAKTVISTQSLSQTHPSPIVKTLLTPANVGIIKPEVDFIQPAFSSAVIRPEFKTVYTQPIIPGYPSFIPKVAFPAPVVAQPLLKFAQPAFNIAQANLAIPQPAFEVLQPGVNAVFSQTLKTLEEPCKTGVIAETKTTI